MRRHFAATSFSVSKQARAVGSFWRIRSMVTLNMFLSVLTSLDKSFFSTTVLRDWPWHDRLLHSLLEHGDFLNLDVSQGSVATRHVWGVEWFNDYFFYFNFTNESESERILEIGQHLTKLWLDFWPTVYLHPKLRKVYAYVEYVDLKTCIFNGVPCNPVASCRTLRDIYTTEIR